MTGKCQMHLSCSFSVFFLLLPVFTSWPIAICNYASIVMNPWYITFHLLKHPVVNLEIEYSIDPSKTLYCDTQLQMVNGLLVAT